VEQKPPPLNTSPVATQPADADLHQKQREKRWKIRSPRGKVMPISSAQLASSPYKPTNFATETS
jgi:hypothetical protein